MPRRNLLTPAERAGLLALPATDDERIQHYTLAEPDLSVIHQRRGSHNRLGFGVQLCYLRFPGIALPTNAEPPTSLLSILSHQLHIAPDVWPQYVRRRETRREHLLELPAWLRLTPFTVADHRHCVLQLSELAQQTDRGIVLAEALVGMLRQQRIILPTVDVIERVCSEALTSGTRRVYEALMTSVTRTAAHSMDCSRTLRAARSAG